MSAEGAPAGASEYGLLSRPAYRGEFAVRYAEFRPRPPEDLFALLLSLAPARPPELVVDLGAGTGISTAPWSGRACGWDRAQPGHAPSRDPRPWHRVSAGQRAADRASRRVRRHCHLCPIASLAGSRAGDHRDRPYPPARWRVRRIRLRLAAADRLG